MQKCEDDRSPARPEIAVGVCCTCLAADRDLFSLKTTPQLLNVCNGLTLSKANMVCFECRARLHNFVKFRSCALRAERLLSCIPPNCHLPQRKILQIFSSSGIKCLSTLTHTVISPYDTICMTDGDHVQVKIEVVDPDSELKPGMLEFIVEPLSVPVNELKTERNRLVEEESMSYTSPAMQYDEDDDDSKSDTASEDGDLQQVEDPLITRHYTPTQMDLAEVLFHMETTRSQTRYKRSPFKCDKCARAFTAQRHFRRHNERHGRESGGFKCEICARRYRDRGALKQHTAKHYVRYECRHCPRNCFNYTQMYFHYRNVHDETTSRLCGKCPASFKTFRELSQHRHRAHGRKYPCPRCERQYATSVGLQRHSLVHDETVPLLECSICHKNYKGETNLRNHMRDVHEMNPGAYCAECDMQFKTPSQYKQHLKRTKRHVPFEDSKFICDYCGKRFAQKPTLTFHIEVTHLKLSKYQCDVCLERFHTKRNVLRHAQKKHNSEPRRRKHVCHICAKAFAMRKSLDEHMNGHLGVRPFECQLCGATFAYSSALYNHNQLVHLKKTRKSKKSAVLYDRNSAGPD